MRIPFEALHPRMPVLLNCGCRAVVGEARSQDEFAVRCLSMCEQPYGRCIVYGGPKSSGHSPGTSIWRHGITGCNNVELDPLTNELLQEDEA